MTGGSVNAPQSSMGGMNGGGGGMGVGGGGGQWNGSGGSGRAQVYNPGNDPGGFSANPVTGDPNGGMTISNNSYRTPLDPNGGMTINNPNGVSMSVPLDPNGGMTISNPMGKYNTPLDPNGGMTINNPNGGMGVGGGGGQWNGSGGSGRWQGFNPGNDPGGFSAAPSMSPYSDGLTGGGTPSLNSSGMAFGNSNFLYPWQQSMSPYSGLTGAPSAPPLPGPIGLPRRTFG